MSGPREMIIKFVSQFGKSGDTTAAADIKAIETATTAATAAAEKHARSASGQSAAMRTTGTEARQEAQSVNLVTKALQELAQKQDEAKASTDGLNESQKALQATVGNSSGLPKGMADQNALSPELEKATRASMALDHAVQGGTQGLRGMEHMAFQLGGTFGNLAARASMIGGAFLAGWEVGNKIREALIDPLIEATTHATALAAEAEKDAEKFKSLGEVKLKNLLEEVKAISGEVSKLNADLERAYARQNALDAAKKGAEIATIEATEPAGPERDRHVAAVTEKDALSKANREIEEANNVLHNNAAALSKAQADVVRTEAERGRAIEQQHTAAAAAKELLDTNTAAHAADVWSAEDIYGKNSSQAESVRKGAAEQSIVDAAEYTKATAIYRQAAEEADAAADKAKAAQRKLADEVAQSNADAQNRIQIAQQSLIEAKARFTSADQKAKREISQRTLDNAQIVADAEEEMENPTTLQGIRNQARSLDKQVRGSVDAAYRDDAGHVHRGGDPGIATRSEALAAIADAERAVQGGAKPEDVTNALIEKLRQMSAIVYSRESDIRKLMDDIAAIQIAQSNQESQSRTASGFSAPSQ